MKNIFLLISFVFCVSGVDAQEATITGQLQLTDEIAYLANIQVEGTDFGTTTDEQGQFSLQLPEGSWTIVASYIGYSPQKQIIEVSAPFEPQQLSFVLQPLPAFINQVVVTGTKTFKRATNSPVIVNVISDELMDNVQACNLSEGLKFQPGLRVETDCQTCNYTQLRMNGLGGGYSQILINGRPIFSPLTGLYGLEQIPTDMIERIEIVRGGGSALYGSNAIGGTVNVITKLPTQNAYDIGYNYQNINGGANDHILSGNATVINEQKTAGAAFFVNNRNREAYDHNGDNFSELAALKNTSFGTNLYFQPTDNQKLEISLSQLNEYRYGGEMVKGAAHLAQQAEERTHNVLIGSADYQLNFNEDNSSLIAYVAGQRTDRTHYTGIFPDDPAEITTHLTAPPYGTSLNTTYQGGLQANHRFEFLQKGNHVLTVGGEYIVDDIVDEIEAYNYLVDQVTRNLGFYAQSDLEFNPKFSLLLGVRADHHNLVDRVLLNPRASFLYKMQPQTQFRLTYGTGFRAPQAFDADLHIAFAGGGISRISLAENLTEERSQSISGSINHDHIEENWIAGFTLEGFYTQLTDAFYLQPIGEDTFGERFEKRNGPGSTVQGATLEVRANYNQKAQLEAGFTIQSSLFDEPVENIEGLEATRQFLRTPNEYGYATLSYFPTKRFKTTLNMVYTGSMQIAHFAGAPEQDVDEYIASRTFTEWSVKSGYTFDLAKLDTQLEIYGGIKNLTNAYQDDFDTGKNRDSNFVYGPAMPRTFFVGVKFKG